VKNHLERCVEEVLLSAGGNAAFKSIVIVGPQHVRERIIELSVVDAPVIVVTRVL